MGKLVWHAGMAWPSRRKQLVRSDTTCKFCEGIQSRVRWDTPGEVGVPTCCNAAKEEWARETIKQRQRAAKEEPK